MSAANVYASPFSPVIATPSGVKLSVVALLVAYGAFIALVARWAWTSGNQHFQRVVAAAVACYLVCISAMWKYHQLIVAVNTVGIMGASDLTLLKQYETVAAGAFCLPIAGGLALTAYQLYAKSGSSYDAMNTLYH